MRISDWSSDVCSSDLGIHGTVQHFQDAVGDVLLHIQDPQRRAALAGALEGRGDDVADRLLGQGRGVDDHGVEAAGLGDQRRVRPGRSEEHTSELQSLMRISYAVFCLKKKKPSTTTT